MERARLRALELVARAEQRFRDEMWAALSDEPGTAWARYESTYARTRAVEHHLELVEADLLLLGRELEQRPRDPLLLELRAGFLRCRDDLRGLREAGRFTLEGLGMEIDWARRAAGVDPRARAELRQGMEWACTLADEGARFVAEHLDVLEQRMAALDAEAAERRAALREVEEALE